MLTDIQVLNARVHNLKNASVTLPRNALIVFTGLSGSGKSSLAFDTIFAEGQRRYMESLSSYARQFLDKMDKPDVDAIEGLSPAISIDQKTASHNPRSTVGTVTEIYDYMRLLFASIGQPHCPQCHAPIQRQSVQEIQDAILNRMAGQSVTILAPVIREKKGEHRGVFETAQKDGFVRIMVNGTLYRLDETLPTLDKNKKHTLEIVVDRLTISVEESARLFESLETALRTADGLAVVSCGDTHTLFSEHLACATCQISLPEMSPRLFSFNAPAGACPACKGLGEIMDFDPDLVIAHPENALRTCTGKVINIDNTYYGQACSKAAKQLGFSLDTPYKDLTEKQRNVFLYGVPNVVDYNPFLEQSDVRTSRLYGGWEGLLTNLRRRYVTTPSEAMRVFFQGFMCVKPCMSCHGARLRPEAIHVRLHGFGIHELCQKSVGDLAIWMQDLSLTEKEMAIVGRVYREIVSRVGFLTHVGLDYLTLARKSNGLSGGEFQRIRLATQIGAGLTGVLYVLDEPSIGLHQRDNQRLIEALLRLRDIGNTLIVVEHDEDMVRIADHVVDIGPRAGRHGGHVVFSGSVSGLLACTDSITGDYLSGRKKIQVPEQRRSVVPDRMLSVHGARENNLKNITVHFPLGCLVCVTGVSGSGKSTLVTDVLQPALMRHFYNSKERPGAHDRLTGLEHLDKVILIDQSPIGRTPRSNPATYTGLFGPLRELFASTKEAKIRGYGPGRFSFNVKGGRCEACEGDGVVKIEMHFLADVFVTCEVCKGKRYNTQTLEVRYKGYHISDVLNMTVDDALDLFSAVPAIRSKLSTLQDVGLGYVQLGQNATTLSGGEAQRIKLAKELSKRSTGKTVYLLDEPTTGLHFADIAHLLEVLNRLTNGGNTVIVIEHNLDVIKTADYIIDLGPDGGVGGGDVVVMGTPEEVAATPASHTGRFLAPLLATTRT